MNLPAIRAIYKFEMARWRRTLWQSVVSPVVSTSLYFVVFGSAIGSRIAEIDGVPYGAFIVPGLIMLTILTQSVMNASFGIYFPRFAGTIYEVLSAPISYLEIVIGYVGAAATKSIIIGLIILATAFFFVPYELGTKEGSLYALFDLAGLDPRAGVYTAIVSRARDIIWIAGGLGLLAVTRHRTTETGPIAGTPVKPAA